MKIKALALVLLVQTLAFAAHAKKQRSDFPPDLAVVGDTHYISIPEMRVYSDGLVEDLIGRSSFGNGYGPDTSMVIATVRRGEVQKFDNFPNSKALSKNVLKDLERTQACDLEIGNGPCLVYGRRDGDGRAIVIGTLRVNGETQIRQAPYTYDSRGRASSGSLVARLQKHSNAKYILFTSALREPSPVYEVSKGNGRARRAQ